MIKNIFISFSGNDELYAAKLAMICSKTYKFDNIFYAPSSIKPGEKWQLEIKHEIQNTDLVIVLWSENSRTSFGQVTEIGASWILEKNILVVIKNVPRNNIPFILNDYQYILWGDFISDFKAFIENMPNKPIKGDPPKQDLF